MLAIVTFTFFNRIHSNKFTISTNNSPMKSFGILFFFITVFKFSYSQEIVNGSFEIVNSKVIPRNWQISNTDNKYIIKIDSVQKQSGKYAISIDGSAFANASLINDGIVYNSFGTLSAKKITTIEIDGWVKMKTPDRFLRYFIYPGLVR